MAMPTALGRDEEVFAALYLALDRRCLRVRAQWIEKLVVGIAPQDGEALLPPHICIQENISFIRGLLPYSHHDGTIDALARPHVTSHLPYASTSIIGTVPLN
jgi:hypothetical protein